METSKVRKFWTFNPFYPELSGMLLILFYTVIIWVCFGVFPIWISPPCIDHEVFFFFFFLLLVLFFSSFGYIQVEKTQGNSEGEKKSFFCSYTIFFFFIFNFWLFLVIFKEFLVCCWNSSVSVKNSVLD